MALRILEFPISRSYFFGFYILPKLSCSHRPGPVNWESTYMRIPYRSNRAPRSSSVYVSSFLTKNNRLDELCVRKFPQHSKTFLHTLIREGKVFLNGKSVVKPGRFVSDDAVVEIKDDSKAFVSRGGYKLESAIKKLNIDVADKVALDSGISTGGFTDCLLQYGASRVYGVDVGVGQVAETIRNDERVHLLEGTNLRYLSEFPEKVDLVTLDLIFIPILTVMPSVINLMKDDATLVTLIKPQFESQRSQVGDGGIVKDPRVVEEARVKVIKGLEELGFRMNGWMVSPRKSSHVRNTEFFAKFTRIGGASSDEQIEFENKAQEEK